MMAPRFPRTQAHTLRSRPSLSRKRMPDAENHDVSVWEETSTVRSPILATQSTWILLGAWSRVQQRTQKSLCLTPRGEGTGATVGTQLCGLGCRAEPFREPHGPARSRHPNTQPPRRGRVNAPFKLTRRISELGALGLGWEVHAGTL